MNNSEYFTQFDEKDIINVFSKIIKADAPIDRDVDILNVEMFFDKYCVAIGLDGIADLIISEYNKRAENYFGCVTDKSAKEMALSALKERFLYDGYTIYKADSPFASAFDWLAEKYKLLEIPLDIDGEQRMSAALLTGGQTFHLAAFDGIDFADSVSQIKQQKLFNAVAVQIEEFFG